MNLLLFYISKTLKILILSIVTLSSFKALADEKSTQLQIDARVAPFCSIEANPLTFHRYSAIEVTSSTSIIVKCTNGTNYSISISGGNNNSNSFRNMRLNSSLLKYQLYKDQNMRIVWGDNQTNSLIGVGTGETQIYKVYGVILADQPGQAGTYNDSLLVNINMLNLASADSNLSGYQMMVRMNISVDKL